MEYIITRRYKKMGMDGANYNLPYGTKCYLNGDIIFYNGSPLCTVFSQDAYDYFSKNDDGYGLKRGDFIHDIQKMLRPQDKLSEQRWDRIWSTPAFLKFKRKEYTNHWLWNHDFYNATMEELKQIYDTIKNVH